MLKSRSHRADTGRAATRAEDVGCVGLANEGLVHGFAQRTLNRVRNLPLVVKTLAFALEPRQGAERNTTNVDFEAEAKL